MILSVSKLVRSFSPVAQISVSLEVESKNFTIVSKQRSLHTSATLAMGGGKEQRAGTTGKNYEESTGSKAKATGKQTSIASFFGGGSSKPADKGSSKQPSIASFYVKDRATAVPAAGENKIGVVRSAAKDKDVTTTKELLKDVDHGGQLAVSNEPRHHIVGKQEVLSGDGNTLGGGSVGERAASEKNMTGKSTLKDKVVNEKEKGKRRKRMLVEEEDEDGLGVISGDRGVRGGKSSSQTDKADVAVALEKEPDTGTEKRSPFRTTNVVATPSPPEPKPPRAASKIKGKEGELENGGKGSVEAKGEEVKSTKDAPKKRRRLVKTSEKVDDRQVEAGGELRAPVLDNVGKEVEMEVGGGVEGGADLAGNKGVASEVGSIEKKDVRSFFLGPKGVKKAVPAQTEGKGGGPKLKEGVAEGGSSGEGTAMVVEGEMATSEGDTGVEGVEGKKRNSTVKSGPARKRGRPKGLTKAKAASPALVLSAEELLAGKVGELSSSESAEAGKEEEGSEGELVLTKAIEEEVSSGADGESEVEEVEKESTGGENAMSRLMGAAKKAGKPRANTAVKRKTGGKSYQPGVGDGLTALALKHGDYEPLKAATWKPGEHIPFAYLAQVLEEISKESKRLAITELLCNAFRTVMATTPEDLLPIVYLSANRVASPHEGVELGIGDATIMKALAEATGRKEAQIKSEYKACGDLGLVAKASRTTQRTMFAPPPLACARVFEVFRFIAKEAGSQSNDKKRAHMKQLIVAARENEPQFIVRLLQGKMRIGLAEQTVLAALAQAAVLQENPPVPAAKLPGRLEEAVRLIKQAFSVLPVYERLVGALLAGGVRSLPSQCRFTPGVPVGPMLAKPTKGISEVLDKFQDREFTCEYKYDGERAQIHYLEDGTVEIYSRNAERNTQKFPDITGAIQKYVKPGVSSFVLDTEAVAYDREKDRILPFQVLSTRARKGVILGDIKVQVCVYAFDLLYLNGRELLQEQLITRRQLLYESFQEVKGEFQFSTAITTRDTDEMQTFLQDAVNHSCEGCMVKTLEGDATYEPAKRSNNWLKLKKDYMDNLGDSLDLVPIGAFHGKGKRAGVFGAFLLACYDDSSEEYQSICKIGTGFSDVILEERSRTLREHVLDKPPAYFRFGESLGADVWFEPVQVWEVKAADLSISPVHRAANGLVDASKGIALRFPRYLRIRDDKTPEQATSAEQVADMYRAQKINHQHGGNDD